MKKDNEKEYINVEKQLDTVAACIKMPISHECGCKKNLSYNPSSMICRKCVLSGRFISIIFNSDLHKALERNDLEKAIDILSEVK